MNFDIPQEMQDYLVELDDFIEKEILPLQMENDNNRFFDHRREDARTVRMDAAGELNFDCRPIRIVYPLNAHLQVYARKIDGHVGEK